MIAAPIRSTAELLRLMHESPDSRLISKSAKASLDGNPLYAVYDLHEGDHPSPVLLAYVAAGSEADALIFRTIRDGTDLTPDLARELPLRYEPMAAACILASTAKPL
jgi:hypothetical protein